MRWATLALLVVTACSASGGETTTTGPAPPTTTVTTTTATTTPPRATPELGCPEGRPMTGSGRVLLSEPGDSDTGAVAEVTWTVDRGCERFRVGFETPEGAPATTPPPLSVQLLPGGRILRIAVDAADTVLTDQLVETPLVRRMYLVRALTGGLFLDLHLAGSVRVRAEVSRSPAQLELELEADDRLPAPPAAIGDRVVVISPVNGAEVPTTVTVSGYARTFEGNVVIEAMVGNEVFATVSTTAADWVETWGEFSASILIPVGEASLFVGEESPEGGGREGVTLSLTAR